MVAFVIFVVGEFVHRAACKRPVGRECGKCAY